MSRAYILQHFQNIRAHACVIEQRLDDSDLSLDALIRENEENLQLCQKYGCDYILLDDRYEIDLTQILSEHPVREAVFADMALASQIMVTSFRTAFAAFVSADTLDQYTVPENCRALLEQIFQNRNMHFLMGGNSGFLCWQDTETGAEIVALHCLPESRGTGLGHALLTETFRRIGDRPVYLWAFEENTRARKFYEKHGLRFDGSRRISEFDEAVEVRYVKYNH